MLQTGFIGRERGITQRGLVLLGLPYVTKGASVT